MQFWWVNHKQTYKQEVGNGYIWSPKTLSNGRKNHFYETMRRVLPGDVVFSYASGQIRQVGVISRPAASSPRPVEFGTTGQQWDDNGWMVPVDWQTLPTPFIPKDNLTALTPLLPEKYSPFSAETGRGNQGAYLAGVSERLGRYVLGSQPGTWGQDFLKLAQGSGDDDGALRILDDAISQTIQDDVALSQTERQAQVQARRGQGKFRTNVEAIETGCRISGITDPRHLTASHIKPWRVCETGTERIDGHNGFLLCPNIDHLFDRGYISFSDEGTVLVAAKVDRTQLALLGCQEGQQVNGRPFTEQQKAYLAYHRANVFLPG